jgi:hypothetical protein
MLFSLVATLASRAERLVIVSRGQGHASKLVLPLHPRRNCLRQRSQRFYREQAPHWCLMNGRLVRIIGQTRIEEQIRFTTADFGVRILKYLFGVF